ncbi:G-protein coupled receptor Mth2-like isoform X4 [Schistocerca gregaria]|uniref:G-protein coupled receptor Mth2-like isoform X4 n=1 Tax=Schistocerca gregaria TaxID=7010 RepID=UPI00211DA797|nr:G-protein coupled receptor Mth2-like isoform X4 [Schistocerca gregaria]
MRCTLPARAVILAAVAMFMASASEEEACEPALSMAVENGRLESSSELRDGEPWLVDVDSGVRYPPGLYWSSGSSWRACYCHLQPCLRMCCQDGWTIVEGSTECEPSPEGSDGEGDVEGMVLVPEDLRRVFGSPPCPEGFIEASFEEIEILDSGTIYAFNETHAPYNVSQYCLATWNGSLSALLCTSDMEQPPPPEEGGRVAMFVVTSICMVVSCAFLAATFFAYASCRLRASLHGKALMSHVAALFFGYATIALLNMAPGLWGTICFVVPFIIYFSFLASFFWLNVMCFDIFWTFSGFRSLRGTAREREHKKFIIYSIYSWGCPLILLSVTLVMQFHNDIPDGLLRPQFGVKRCWFPDDITILAYFYGPVGVLVLCNIILFILTAIRIAQLKRETAMLKGTDSRRHDDDNRQRFNLYLKLFLVMGVNWSMEVISGLVGGPEYVWYVTDICNTLQGVLIFVIFVWKDRIRRMLMEKFCPKRASTKLSKSTVVTYSTRASPSRLSHGVLNNKVTDNSNGDVVKITAITPISDDSDVP